MERKRYAREFKLEAVRLVKERVSVAQASRDLGVHANVLREWSEPLRRILSRPSRGGVR